MVISIRWTDAYDYESITVGATVAPLSSSKYEPAGEIAAHRVVMTCETAPLRYRYDGVDPTATEGHRLVEGEVIELVGINNIRKFRAIREGTTDAILKVTYER